MHRRTGCKGLLRPAGEGVDVAFAVLGKMPKAKAEREAYDVIVEKYGEEKLRKEFEL